MLDKRKLGKKSRAAGKRFELRVREDLERQGQIVFRNSNDVTPVQETNIGEYERFFKQAKSKWNWITKRPMGIQNGFPDFLILKQRDDGHGFVVKFVECKLGKYLDKEEKEKVRWIKEKLKIPVLIASRGIKRGEIIYNDA
jgi:hypothetical protein